MGNRRNFARFFPAAVTAANPVRFGIRANLLAFPTPHQPGSDSLSPRPRSAAMNALLQQLARRIKQAVTPSSRPAPRRGRLGLEALEDRLVLSPSGTLVGSL